MKTAIMEWMTDSKKLKRISSTLPEICTFPLICRMKKRGIKLTLFLRSTNDSIALNCKTKAILKNTAILSISLNRRIIIFLLKMNLTKLESSQHHRKIATEKDNRREPYRTKYQENPKDLKPQKSNESAGDEDDKDDDKSQEGFVKNLKSEFKKDFRSYQKIYIRVAAQ
ncbi:MAG: hypothetical protein U5Q03_17465 [Bacteroidota bacterium]|nr:hypothetical protein [Bacteroidota bacterium]